MHAADLMSARARLTPGRVALVDLHTGVRYTYRELGERANRAANFLAGQLGIGQSDRVSILAHNSPVYLDLFYGLAKIGAILAPLNWRLTARELTYIVGDCEPKVTLCGPEFTGLLDDIRRGADVGAVVGVEGAPVGMSYEDGVAAASPVEPRPLPLTGEEPHCIFYTSGTTGRPKGAVLPQRQTVWNAINTVASWGLRETDVSPIFTPMFHIGAWGAFLTPILYLGGRITLARGFDAEASLRSIVEERCTVVLGVPTLFQMWSETPYFAEADFSHVRYFINGGARCPVPLMEHWRKTKGVVFRQGYGLTEVGPNCFSMTDEESVPKSGTVGKPIFHSRMRLVDPATGREVGPGETGELLISGPHVCSGYWRNPEATAEVVTRDPACDAFPWFHTGDMASRDEDGFYTIQGRYKDMIKSGGENVYAVEVEVVFRDHPAVAEAALIGQPDEKWGEVGLMVVALKPGMKASEAELLDFCRDKLARFKIPRRVVFADALPYSPYGKIEKTKLRQHYLQGGG